MGVKVPAHYRPKVTSAILSSWVVHNLVNRESHPCRVGEAQCRRGGQIVGGKHPSNPIAGDCHNRTVSARPTSINVRLELTSDPRNVTCLTLRL